jgi:hypothetical protein
VLLLYRDNSKLEVKRRLRAWGGAAAKALKVLTRDDVPPLTDSEAWAQFPFGDYDLVILDSLNAATEVVKRQTGAPQGWLSRHCSISPAVALQSCCSQTPAKMGRY